ncbi:hypothetical protein [Micromonospora saelicesensis]|nr:hypothetical protein [Micromonospora saelicesensis]
MPVRVTGSAQLHKVMQVLKETGNKGLGKGMAAGFRMATAPLGPAVSAEVPKAMPSGYAPVLSRSLQFKTQARAFKHVARVTWRVYGDGQQERRDVPALNRGLLRHPLYGNRQWWIDQKVRKGFVDRPLDRLGVDVRREMNKVIDQVADKIARG